jgi:hypothetical protein
MGVSRLLFGTQDAEQTLYRFLPQTRAEYRYATAS